MAHIVTVLDIEAKDCGVLDSTEVEDRGHAIITAEGWVDEFQDKGINAVALVYNADSMRVVYAEGPVNGAWGH